MAQAKANPKSSIAAKSKTAKSDESIKGTKIIARNITNHVIQLHLPGGRYVRMAPSETCNLSERECGSKIIKKLEGEHNMHIHRPHSKETESHKPDENNPSKDTSKETHDEKIENANPDKVVKGGMKKTYD